MHLAEEQSADTQDLGSNNQRKGTRDISDSLFEGVAKLPITVPVTTIQHRQPRFAILRRFMRGRTINDVKQIK